MLLAEWPRSRCLTDRSSLLFPCLTSSTKMTPYQCRRPPRLPDRDVAVVEPRGLLVAFMRHPPTRRSIPARAPIPSTAPTCSVARRYASPDRAPYTAHSPSTY